MTTNQPSIFKLSFFLVFALQEKHKSQHQKQAAHSSKLSAVSMWFTGSNTIIQKCCVKHSLQLS